MKIRVSFLPWTGKASLAVEIPSDTREQLRLKVALELSVKTNANLNGANLDGANLVGANFVGANLYGKEIKHVLAICSRVIESYQFVLWRMREGEALVCAGLRWSALVCAGCHGPWTITRYREHVAANYAGTSKAAETLRILDFFEATDRATAETVQSAT